MSRYGQTHIPSKMCQLRGGFPVRDSDSRKPFQAEMREMGEMGKGQFLRVAELRRGGEGEIQHKLLETGPLRQTNAARQIIHVHSEHRRNRRETINRRDFQQQTRRQRTHPGVFELRRAENAIDACRQYVAAFKERKRFIGVRKSKFGDLANVCQDVGPVILHRLLKRPRRNCIQPFVDGCQNIGVPHS